jgi:uncharacterized protein YecE (DUF72 family)
MSGLPVFALEAVGVRVVLGPERAWAGWYLLEYPDGAVAVARWHPVDGWCLTGAEFASLDEWAEAVAQ